MTTAEESTSAVSHFIDASTIRERLVSMTRLNAERAVPDSTFESALAALEADKDLANFMRHAAGSAYFGGRDTHCSLLEAFSRTCVTLTRDRSGLCRAVDKSFLPRPRRFVFSRRP